MKRILFIAPESFPVMSSESICNSKVAYVLASAGYKVDVYTCDDRDTYPEDNLIDAYLRNHKNLRIFPVRNSKVLISRSNGFKSNFKNLIFNLGILLKTGFWYNGISIPYSIYKSIEDNIRKEGDFDYDFMITRATYCDLAAILLKRKYNIIWNANWNDPFPDKKFPEPYGRGYNTKLPFFENRIFKAIQKMVDIHTFPSERLRKYQLKCFPLVKTDKTMVIPHMAHSELLPIIQKPKLDSSVLQLVHCGSVGKPRDPGLFLEALSRVLIKRTFDRGQIHCSFVGRYDENLDQIINHFGLEDVVSLIPPMSYSDSLSYISQCDVSLIIEAQCEEGIYLPTKFVDAMQTHKPVFCVSPSNGTLRYMVSLYNVGYYSDNTSVISIEKVIEQMLLDFKNNNLPTVDNNVASDFFEDSIIDKFRSII